MYVALHDSARESKSLGTRHDMMASRRPYWRSVWMSGHVVGAPVIGASDIIAFGVAAFVVAAACMADFVDVAFGVLFRELATARSSVERLRFIALVSAPMCITLECPSTVGRMITG